MKKLVSFIIFVLCLLLSTAVYAGGHGGGGHYGGGGYRGGGHYGGHGGYGHGGGYYGGHGGYYGGRGYNSWAVGINLGGYPYYPYYGYGPYWGYGCYAPVYYAPAPVYYAPAPVYYAPSGHWETQKVWVPGSQRYWVDQYYDRGRDVWVLGHWEERPGGPGYWTQQQVWVVQ
jgi:hypothetical protein